MFTGIVTATGTLRAVEGDGAQRIAVEPPARFAAGIATGASVAVDGVCLTVSAIGDGTLEFDVVAETLSRTTLGERLANGGAVNLERSAKLGDELGGHLLSGHVAAVAEVVAVETDAGVHDLRLRVGRDAMACIFEKGFVALDGISLTVGRTRPDSGEFVVHIIPETLARTTIGARQPGDRLNVEVDALTRAAVETVTRIMEAR
ncbi:MAG: riboflavin synthase subunit alpha [Candidatus Poseidoniia archaeon]|jgi:riboflavin synthase|nr:riboflavin synthase subunit alpha [Candidatus Poseidoniia archaeon]MDP6659169.1 riboflavin synthase subunit alpha [Candidatus Poseidoniia archaeon]MDP6846344.1 riboflavin synthase subunit alpha [Candidatus Poseidoniia archaeon]MDP7006624.1 riboflavin synthase subunit alpha [Candidatus Poseidoniia archaeon]